MAIGDQINFRPWFEQHTVPCEGEVGDILVLTPLTPLNEGQADPEQQGSASVWFCTKAQFRERPAVWARVQFDGVATCETGPLPTPPQTRPTLKRG